MKKSLNKPKPQKSDYPKHFKIKVEKSVKGEKELERKCKELKEMTEKIHKANEVNRILLTL